MVACCRLSERDGRSIFLHSTFHFLLPFFQSVAIEFQTPILPHAHTSSHVPPSTFHSLQSLIFTTRSFHSLDQTAEEVRDSREKQLPAAFPPSHTPLHPHPHTSLLAFHLLLPTAHSPLETISQTTNDCFSGTLKLISVLVQGLNVLILISGIME